MEKFDSKSTLDKMIKSINKYADKRDDYDENSGLKIAKKVKFAMQGAETLNLDPNMAAQFIIGEGLSHLAYGKLGEEYLKRIDPKFSIEDYTSRLINGILHGESKVVIDEIVSGVNRYRKGEHREATEQFAYMMLDGFDYADAIKQKDYRDVCYINYKNKILRMSMDAKMLTGPTIPEIKQPRPKNRQVNRRKALMRINTAQRFYKEHIGAIPIEIRRAFGDLGEDKLSAYYAVTLPERELEKLYKDQDKEREQ